MVEDEFDAPYVNVDEWRDDPVRHRYVHGGFAGTELRFSVYLPPAEQYEGRFFQHITPVPDSEHLAQGLTGEEDKIGFSIASGAYFLETNGGGPSGRPGSDIDPTIAAYRANAAAARHSRVIAAEMYGEHRPYGYAYGGSGGGFRTIGGAENTTGVWDGFVPYVIGSPVAIPNCFTVRMHAQRVLRHHLDEIADAVDAGGSGDPYGTLDEEERDVLLEVTRMGFPLRSWFGHRTMGMQAFPLLFQGVTMADPGYFDEFWTESGYLGHEPPPSLERDVVHHAAEIVAVLSARETADARERAGAVPGQARSGVDHSWKGDDDGGPASIRLSHPPEVDVLGAELLITSGASAGATVQIVTTEGDLAVIGHADPEVVRRIEPGDAVELDNRRYLAAQTYHRHQDPGEGYEVWDQFRDEHGSPRYPQRPLLLGPLFAQAAAGTVQTGRFEGRMIVVASLLDREAFPWQADWYRQRVEEHLGADADDRFRLWYVDYALHGDDEAQEHPTRTVSYLGVLHQALRDLAAWVEQDVTPPRTTDYDVDQGQIVLADGADRGGVQPVVSLTADGRDRVEVGEDEVVTLRAVAEVPGGIGQIVCVEWDLDRTGQFAVRDTVEPGPRVEVERRCSFPAPGTWFPTVRVAAQRQADSTPYGRLQNLARARVVVG